MPFYHGLRRAILDRDLQDVQKWLDRGVDVNKRISDSGVTPLNMAMYMGHIGVIQLLLRYGADPNQRSVCRDSEDGEEEYPIMVAARLRNVNFAQLLIDHHALVNKKDSASLSPLYYAAMLGNSHVAALLINSGADLNLPVGKLDATALQAAVQHGHQGMVKLLCDNQAKVNSRDKEGNTPLHCATDKSLKAMVQLMECNANLEAVNLQGHTPLVHLIKLGHYKAAMLLISHGANVRFMTSISTQDLPVQGAFGADIFMVAPPSTHLPPSVMNLIHMVVLGGWDSRQLLNIMQLQYLQLSQDGSLNLNDLKTFCDWLTKFNDEPMALRDLCRISIRANLRKHTGFRSIVKSVKSLPLPMLMQEYLCFQ
ncbi:ankyrin-1 [Lingula anatina]|uniref:Ankyrin-1 n=1 Tax=Lingula anatina TaxID=7574 RepID=A0A1S3KCN3_LINAN|nr:ankyrin-1 [Lingula anatina]|eukprot:XP_013420199.1 ankyrin-1 [Lingula anatina]